MTLLKLLISLVGLVLAGSAFAAQPGDKIDNFTLVDHLGVRHELHQYADKKAVVLFVQGNGCPIARNHIHTYAKLRDEFAAQGVEFLMINSNLQDNQVRIANEATEFKIDFPILVDEEQKIGGALRFERTADSFVINPKDWTIAYRGALDDRLGYENQKVSAKDRYVANALDAIIANKPVAVTQVEAKGCLVVNILALNNS